MEYDIKHIQFKHPFTCMVSGPTSSGKTVLVRRILSQSKYLVAGNINNVMWAYGQWQKLYNTKIDNVKCIYNEGLPNEDDLLQNKIDLIVIDDLMNELGSNKKLTSLFTKGSHHNNISVIFITQNLFHQGNQIRTISLNCHYIILMKNPRDKRQIQYLGNQVFSNNTKFFIEAFNDAT